MTDLALPKRAPGRQWPKQVAEYEAKRAAWCAAILQIAEQQEFKVSTRGWCYGLEEYGLSKGDFDEAEKLINDCRKSGELPLNICAEDEAREAKGVEQVDHETPEEFADSWVFTLQVAHQNYLPTSFWENQEHYVELVVEKIDLRSLFEPVVTRYSIPITNMGGWCYINARANMLRRIAGWQARGKTAVILICTDHDPKGLQIADTLKKNLDDLRRGLEAEGVYWDSDDLVIDRFGLTRAFIDRHRLTWIDGLITSSNKDLGDEDHNDHWKRYVQDYLREHGRRKVEANVLVKPRLIPIARDLCEQTILKYVDLGSVAEWQHEIEEQRLEAKRLIREAVKDDSQA